MPESFGPASLWPKQSCPAVQRRRLHPTGNGAVPLIGENTGQYPNLLLSEQLGRMGASSGNGTI